MISIKNIQKAYNRKRVIMVPTLDVQKGSLVGLVGNNGAGKTTLFRLLLDLIKADTGIACIDGYNVANGGDWKKMTAAYIDESFLIPYLTPHEYFYFVGKLHGITKGAVEEFLQSLRPFFDVTISKRNYIRDLSRGNQCRVGIAACLLQNPRLLILDEPFANLDPSSQIRLKKILTELNNEKGTTILVSSHDLNHITDLCKRVLLMENGEIIKDIYTGTDTLLELESYFKV